MNLYHSLKELIEIDSPSGFSKNAEEYCFNLLKKLGWFPTKTNKNAVKRSFGSHTKLATADHLENLGAIVSGLNSKGTPSVSMIGIVSLKPGRRRAYYFIYHVRTGMFRNISAE